MFRINPISIDQIIAKLRIVLVVCDIFPLTVHDLEGAMIFAVFAGVLILSMTWYLFFQDNGNSQKLEPKSLLQESITHQQLEKGLRSDTIQDTLKDYGTTRKQ